MGPTFFKCFLLCQVNTTIDKHLHQQTKLNIHKYLQTVAGPMIETPFSAASLMSFRVRFSGMPSAMIAIARI